MQDLIALVALTVMEIVLGIDNIVFISVATARLPVEQQASARKLGLGLAMGMRILLLLFISWIVGLTTPVFTWEGLGIPVHTIQELWNPPETTHRAAEVANAAAAGEQHVAELNNVTVRDLILFGGGLYLLWSSVREIHNKVTGLHEEQHQAAKASFRGVIAQIVLLDVVFSLDSVLTAVGMAKSIWVMIAAVVLAVGVMLIFSGVVAAFVERHPTIKVLALSFLLLIGVMLVAEGLGAHIDKGYVYFAMLFALGVEALNLRMKRNAHKHDVPAELTS